MSRFMLVAPALAVAGICFAGIASAQNQRTFVASRDNVSDTSGTITTITGT